MKSLSRVRLLATPWTAAHQAPPSMGCSRHEHWSGVPLPSPPSTRGRHKLGAQGHHPVWTLDVSSSSCLSFFCGPGLHSCGKYYTQKGRGREGEGTRKWRRDVSGCQVRTSSSPSVRVNANDLWGRPTPGKKNTADEKGGPKSQNKGGLFKRQELRRTSESFASFLTLWPGTKGASAK